MQNYKNQTLLFDHQAENFAKNKNNEKRKRKSARIALLFVAGLLIFLVGLAVLKIPSLWSNLTKPFRNLQSNYYQIKKLNTGKRVNILIVTNNSGKVSEIGYLSFEKRSKKVVVLKFSPQTKIETAEGENTFTDLVVTQSGQVQNIDKLSAALSSSIGYFFDGYFMVTSSANWLESERLDSIFTNLYSPSFIFKLSSSKDFLDNQVKTNLNLQDLYTLTKEVKALEPARFEFISQNTYQTPAGFIDNQALKTATSFKLQDSKVSDEGAVVEIVNASGEEGQGSLLKSILTNLGANVVSVSAADIEQKKTEIFVKKKKLVLTERLKDILKDAKITQQDDLNQVDIKVTIGEDFASLFAY